MSERTVRQASFGRCVSKTKWVYGFKVALSVNPAKLSVVTAFGLAEANSNEWPIGEFLSLPTSMMPPLQIKWPRS